MNQLEYTFTAHNIDAVQIALGTGRDKPEERLVNDITKEKGSSKYTVRLDENMKPVVEGALKAMKLVRAISNLQGPFPFHAAERRLLDRDANVHLDTLLEAFDAIQRIENSAAATEGLKPVCHRIAFWRLEEGTNLYVVGIEVGLLSEGTTIAAAYIRKIHDFQYQLVWK